MTTGFDTAIGTLTDKERQTLRLILRGHDAKSSANELGLSVHTVNERLREARRKLGVTSSREAARRLHEAEAQAPELLEDKSLGDAGTPVLAETGSPAAQREAGFRNGPGLAVILAGVLAMSLILAALFLSASPLSVSNDSPDTAAAEPSDPAAAARAAEDFLQLIDQSRWADSYAATGAQFRQLNTLERWTDVSKSVRSPLGKTVARRLVSNEFVPTPPHGSQLVKFASTYASDVNQVESVSLAFEDGAWRVVGIVIG